MIHRHKHEMTLKFPSIKTDNILSDQTPTPTRFLKNCEEVGLFNELDCSIEQEFRKAQEEEDSKRNISLHGTAGPSLHQPPHSRMPNHDTSIVIQQALPSPQSSSVITQAPSTNRQIGPVPGSLSSLLHLRNRQRQPLPASMPGTLPDPTMPGSSAVLMPMERQMSMGSNIMGMQGPNLTNSCSSPQVPSMHSEAKLRLKATLSHHPAAMPNGNMNTMGHMMEMMSARQDQGPHHHLHPHPHAHQLLGGKILVGNHRGQTFLVVDHQVCTHLRRDFVPLLFADPLQVIKVSPAAQQMQPTQTLQQPQPTGGRRRRVVDEDPDERRRKFLERNRAAATRCRQKRKVWVMSLEKKAEELTQTNMQLQVDTGQRTQRAQLDSIQIPSLPGQQNEVTMLKNEVTQLKQLLLTHKDCPITAMQKESQGYLSPENSPPGSPTAVCTQQQVIQHNTITTSTTAGDAVGNSALNQLANHRTDMNPIL
ncbi:CREB5 protein, partial [Amia calva]|nr:CREB5 protein [Amia calva]